MEGMRMGFVQQTSQELKIVRFATWPNVGKDIGGWGDIVEIPWGWYKPVQGR